MSKQVVIVRTGVANLASVRAGLERAGARVVLSQTAKEVAQAKYLVLPGVGSFGGSMETLQQHGLVDVLRQRIINGRPTLAVCVGQQLLFSKSEESPGVEGLAVFEQEVRRFPDTVRVPHFGWNTVVNHPQCKLFDSGYAYFANSYRAIDVPPGWSAAITDHGGEFISGLERGAVLTCQFHPELSGQWGLNLISRWLNEVN